MVLGKSSYDAYTFVSPMDLLFSLLYVNKYSSLSSSSFQETFSDIPALASQFSGWGGAVLHYSNFEQWFFFIVCQVSPTPGPRTAHPSFPQSELL